MILSVKNISDYMIEPYVRVTRIDDEQMSPPSEAECNLILLNVVY